MLQVSCKEETEKTLQRNLPKVEQASALSPDQPVPRLQGPHMLPCPFTRKVGISVQCQGRMYSMQGRGSGLVPAGE